MSKYLFGLILLLVLACIYFYRQAYCTHVYWFHKPTCPYCVEMQPAWDLFTSGRPGSVKVHKVDKDENPDLAKNFNVTTVPHIVKVKNGVREVYTGDRSAEDLLKWSSI